MWELLPVRIFKQKNNPKYEWILNLCLAHSILSLMDPSPKLGCHQTYQTNLVIIIKSHQIATFAASLAFFRFLRRTRSAASLKRKGSAAVRSLQALEASVEEGSTSESWLNLGPMSWEKWWQFKKTPSLFSYTMLLYVFKIVTGMDGMEIYIDLFIVRSEAICHNFQKT